MTQPDPPLVEPAPSQDAQPASEARVQPEVRTRVAARSDVGQIREHNEDNFLVADLTHRSRTVIEGDESTQIGAHGSLFAVCDGMGGAAAGEIASQLAVDILFERMIDGLTDGVRLSRNDIARRLVRAVEAAGIRIFQEAKADRSRRGMGTTVTAAALLDGHLFLAQVGDSRGYILRGDALVQVTRDQSLVNQLIEAGQLTEEEAETFEHNNIILQALGTSDTVQVDLTFVQLCRGDRLLLCSDGLSGMVRADEIRDIIRSSSDPAEACRVLIEQANLAGGHDNVTVIVVFFEGEGLPPNCSEPLRYRKYALPEEAQDNSDLTRCAGSCAMSSLNPSALVSPSPLDTVPSDAPPSGPNACLPPILLTTGDAPTNEDEDAGPAHPPLLVPVARAEDRIEIPGTHVAAWVVIALVLGVLAILGALAFLLLR